MQDNNGQNLPNFGFEKATENIQTEAPLEQGLRKTFPSSTMAMQEPEKRWKQAKYPWEAMEVGTSFEIKYNEMKLTSLKPYVSRMSKKLNKKFKITDHKQYECYEISRLPDKPRNVIEALNQDALNAAKTKEGGE